MRARRAMWGAAAALLGLFTGAGAQQIPTPPQNQPPINVDFKGGTLGQFVETVTTAARNAVKDAPVNIVFADAKVAQYQVPPVQLRHVMLDTALKAAIYPRSRTGADEILSMEQLGGTLGSEGSQVFVIASVSGRAKPRAQRVEIFDLRDLTRSGTKMEMILTAIEAAVKMEDTGDTEIKYHEDSGLLILRATAAQLEAAGQVVAHLSEGAKQTEAEQMVRDRELQARKVRADLDAQYDTLMRLRAEQDTGRRAAADAERQAHTAEGAGNADLKKQVDEAQRRLIGLDLQVDRAEREIRGRETALQQLMLATAGVRGDGSDVAKLRSENAQLQATIAQLKARIEELEKKGR